MRKARWVTTRDYMSIDRETLQHIDVYAEGETKELVKRENKGKSYKRECVLV